MTPFSIEVILRPNTSRKIRSMGVSTKGLRRAMESYTTSGEGGKELVFSGMTSSSCFGPSYRYFRTSVQRLADIAVSDVSLHSLQPNQATQRGTIS
jgi:hypothetical protein